MIQGVPTKTQREYYQTELDSSSSLKLFADSRKKYFKKYIEGEPEEEEINKSSIIGNLVDCLYLHPENFDRIFYTSQVEEPPSGMMMEFVMHLYNVTVEAMDEEGTVTKEFITIAEEAYKRSSFKLAFPAVIARFDKEGRGYYNELRNTKPKNLQVVNLADVAHATKIVERINGDEFVVEYMLGVGNERDREFRNQLQIEGFHILGLPMKAMLDRVIVDHDDRSIQVVDLKCIWNVENFYEEYYLYRRAYIQAWVYYQAVRHCFKELNYRVLPPAFLVCDSANYFDPIIYSLRDEDLSRAYLGFTHKYTPYRGVESIIEELLWCKENHQWRRSKEVHEAKGIVDLKRIC